MALLRVCAPICPNLLVHPLHSFHINLHAATSDGRLIHSAHALGFWFAAIVAVSPQIFKGRGQWLTWGAQYHVHAPPRLEAICLRRLFKCRLLFQVTRRLCFSLWMDELVTRSLFGVFFVIVVFWLSADPGQVLPMNWTISSTVDFCQEERRNCKFFGALGTSPSVITRITDVSVLLKQAVLGNVTNFFLLMFFMHFLTIFLILGWSKIAFYIHVHFRRLNIDCDYQRSAATDIRSLVKSYQNTAFFQRD